MTSKFDFDTPVDRRNTGSYKWDTPVDSDILPMWVADMDFRTSPDVIEALSQRVEQGVFGYTRVPDEYYEAVTEWFDTNHGYKFDKNDIIYTSGVVPAISAIIKALCKPGEKVITQTPAFNCFFSSIRNNGCELSANELIRNEDGSYSIDYDNLERLAADPAAKLLIFCNPHNPTGRVWSVEEIRHVAEICDRHGVTVVSDEIHCELTRTGIAYNPWAVAVGPEIARRSVVCIAPTKAFNIAGLQIANIVAPDDDMRRKIDRAINDNEVCDVNPFGVIATIAAYKKGGKWLTALREYLDGNYNFILERMQAGMPAFPVTPLQSTYLAWIDCKATGLGSEEISEILIREARLMISPGNIFGKGGDGFIRLNFACPRTVLSDGLNRLTILNSYVRK